ncbi:PIN domain-containing protein [Dehalococcoidia bacterium]|nr:PIN domain-containing protein [Dehalococcoidia bacterium]MCL0087289.1 PIN domain-containing protein [Dehalococcoidia bacterium]
MTSAVDTNILLDILLPDPKFLEASTKLLSNAISKGKVIMSEVVYAELLAQFSSREELDAFLEEANIVVQPTNQAALWEAGRAWMMYIKVRGEELECPKCGYKSDFLSLAAE